MASAGWDLQKSVYATLQSNPSLITLLGDARIYDAVPQSAVFPYVVIDQMQIRDWSTGTEKGSEHVVLLHVWSHYEGKREVCEIGDVLRDALDDAELSLEDHRLVNLNHQYSDLKRDEDGKIYHGIVRFRAVTEPLTY
jgi:hypothetical protein